MTSKYSEVEGTGLDSHVEEDTYRVLVVDDDSTTLQHIEMLLTKKTQMNMVSVTCVADPQLAVNLLQSGTPFDLVLSDMYMPNITGLQMVEIMNSTMKHRTPVILMSCEMDISSTWKHLGIMHFMNKPLRVKDLHKIIEILEAKRKLKKNKSKNASVSCLVSMQNDDSCETLMGGNRDSSWTTLSHTSLLSDEESCSEEGPDQDLNGVVGRSAVALVSYWDQMSTPLDLMLHMTDMLRQGVVPSREEASSMFSLLSTQDLNLPCVFQEDYGDSDPDLVLGRARMLVGCFSPLGNALPRQTEQSQFLMEDSDLHWRQKNTLALTLDCATSSEHKAIDLLLQVDPDISSLPHWSSIEKILCTLPTREFQVFELETLVGKRVLPCVGLVVFCVLGVLETSHLNVATLYAYMRRVTEEMPDNDYHNHVHVADVLHSTALLITQAQESRAVIELELSDLDFLALLFSALVHDIGHPGVNNDFLQYSSHHLAIMYNDKSILEMYHNSKAFQLLTETNLNLFEHFDKSDYGYLRQLVITLVGATNMKKHFKIMTKVKGVVEKLGQLREHKARKVERAGCKGFKPKWHDAVIAAHRITPPEKSLVLCVLIKLADLGHLRAQGDVHRRWTNCLLQECWKQGDQMREKGYPVSPLFERCTPVELANSQVGFFQLFGIPLSSFWTRIVNSEWFEDVERNCKMWQQEAKAELKH
eukprot:CAMPEP_0196598456 /NCGR_PEP_ID=MMETSP1081-20130531/94331_1 /TAXON_ID=36882 /ORGANISM="Pyramimonas amylifera, Strain CCMP720" /LENGTH=701 /DNA_ID=CAMNT_0041924155 /DNA_START=662 /DNA_END=2767 /DNA_ORIENTATION=-